MFFLYWDDKDARYPELPDKIARARYSSLEEAQAQAEHDLVHGRRILRIEDEDGNVAWVPGT